MSLRPTCPNRLVHRTVCTEQELLSRSQICNATDVRPNHHRPVAKQGARISDKRPQEKLSPFNQMNTAYGRIKCTLTGPRLPTESESSPSSQDGDEDLRIRKREVPPASKIPHGHIENTAAEGERIASPKTKLKPFTDVTLGEDDSKPFQDNKDHLFKSMDFEEFSGEQKFTANPKCKKQKIADSDGISSQMKIDECSEDSRHQGVISIVITFPISKRAVNCPKASRMPTKPARLDRLPDCNDEAEKSTSKTKFTSKTQSPRNIDEEHGCSKPPFAATTSSCECECHLIKMKSSFERNDMPIQSEVSADKHGRQKHFASSPKSTEVSVVTNALDKVEPPKEMTPGLARSRADKPAKIPSMPVTDDSTLASISFKPVDGKEENPCVRALGRPPIFLILTSNEEDPSKGLPTGIKVHSVGKSDGFVGGSKADGSESGKEEGLVRGQSSPRTDQNRVPLVETSSSSDSAICPGNTTT
ncbi:hypothetical protein Aperf_G00000103590 [Anoplocephala perfoliata]